MTYLLKTFKIKTFHVKNIRSGDTVCQCTNWYGENVIDKMSGEIYNIFNETAGR